MDRVQTLILVVIASVIAAIVAIINVASRDIPAPDTTDLVLERATVPPEANAYTYFMSATNAFYWPTNAAYVTDYLDGKTVDETALAEIIARNEQAMQLLARGLDCRSCLTPEVTSFDTPLPYITSWRSMGKVMAIEVRHERLAGRHAEATDTCIALLKFADMIQAGAGCTIDYLIGLSVLDLGLAQAQDLARDAGMPPEALERLSNGLRELGPLAPGLIRAIKVEFSVAANAVDQFREGQLGMDKLVGLHGGDSRPLFRGRRFPLYLFQPNKTKLAFADVYRDMINDAPRCYADMRRYDEEGALGLTTNRVRLIIRPNAVGKVLYALFVPALDSLLERKCRAECGVGAARIIAACNAYRKNEGTLPGDLQSLLPTYLTSIPPDPYDGNSFRYLPSAGIIYSVGKDLMDSGGSSKVPAGDKAYSPSQRRWKTEDVVFDIGQSIEQVPGATGSAARK